MIEKWRPVKGHEGAYEVSSYGRVRSLDRIVETKNGHRRHYKGMILSPSPNTQGRLRCRLGKGEFGMVHAIVAEAFHGPRPDGMYVCHNDGNHLNNRASNLRYDTPSANCMDAYRHGRINPESLKTHCPRGHELLAENLSPSHLSKGTRTCLACSRAGAYCRKYKMMDRFKEVADDRYLAILELSKMPDVA